MKKKYITPMLITHDFGHVLILAGTTPKTINFDIDNGDSGGTTYGDGSDAASKKGIWFEEDEDEETYPTEDRFWD